ncbi:helix-turn-helix domain-containing protein [Paenibacillus contaminans]|uniref:HTH cro/C1-type domain-containing protein n=1 Tax=Paenibacillus contaminans TaxID=450362 RepID=A0A329MNM5_9BACL|nr:helix-turn-helix transcriptional regulator [Paenibacillus contaminans]RAV19507.1 hypothetical protein DQG23_21205 [Paenibacillus contaminans]
MTTKTMTKKELRAELARRKRLADRMEAGERLSRDEFITANELDWAEIGRQLQEDRITYQITLSDAAKRIGIAASTLRRFENGEPVRSARIIESAYEMMLEVVDLRQADEAGVV